MRRTQKAVNDRYDLEVNSLFDSNLRNTGDSVVAPNLDVLNSTGFIDFSDPALPRRQRAFVLSVPDTRQDVPDERGTFTIMQVLDAYTNVQGAFGTCVDSCNEDPEDHPRNAGGNYLLAGPTYQRGIPDRLEDTILDIVQIPTSQAWLIGRTAVDAYLLNCPPGDVPTTDYEAQAEACGDPSAFDLSAAKSFEYSGQYTLTPLNQFPNNPTPPAVNPTGPDGEPRERDRRPGTCASDAVNFPMFGAELGLPGDVFEPEPAGNGDCPTTSAPHWSTQDFLEYLGASVQQNGITEGNTRIFRQFRSLGLRRRGYQPPPSTEVVDEGIYRASHFLGYLVERLDSLASTSETTWSINTTLGQYSPNPPGWLTATTVTAVGLGANLARDGIYPLTLKDAGSCPLDGANDYTITFSAADNEFPPVNTEGEDGSPLGFWSLTVYDTNGRIVTSPDGGTELVNEFYGDEAYSLGSAQVENLRGEFAPSEDVTFYFQRESPSLDKLPYWLPVPDGPFEVILRIYAPNMDCFPIPFDGEVTGDCDQLESGKYLPPELVRVTPPAAVCDVGDPRDPGVDRRRLPRRVRRLIKRLDIEGDFLSRLR